MTRAEKIYLFGNLFGLYGGFTQRDVRTHLFYRTLGRGYREYIEGFEGDKVEVVTYYGSRPIRRYYAYYNDLPDNIIDEITYLFEMWESMKTGRGRWDGNRWRYGRYDDNRRWQDGRWYNGGWHGGRWSGNRWHDDEDDHDHPGGHGGGHDDDGHGGHTPPGHDDDHGHGGGGGHEGHGPGHPGQGHGHDDEGEPRH